MGGDHKCPLCDATFTRPQHVGRHFRSHTGDRPYQCKECPQAFARSDLLSRHVNKAHRIAEEGGGKSSTNKKGRRKSMPSSSHPRKEPAVKEDVKSKKVVNRQRSSSLIDSPTVETEPTDHHPALQAQSMYPHHPLLANPDLQTAPPHPQTSPQWDGYNMNQSVPGPLTSSVPLLGTVPNMPVMDQSMQNQFKFPMRFSESDQGAGSSFMGRVQNGSSPNYEYVKKRACDQCSHSKVRCDFAEPCQRCTNRNIFCSYTKTPKARSLSMFPAQRSTYPSSPFRSTTLPINNPNYSPLAFTPSPLGSGMLPPTARNSTSPSSVSSALMPTSQMMPNSNTWSPSSVSPGGSTPSPLTHQMVQAPRPMPTAQPLPVDTSGLPAGVNSFSSVNLPMSHLTATPSLTSMTTSPSGSDEPLERRGSLSGSMTYSSNWIDPSTSMKRAVQPLQEPVQLQTPMQVPYTQMVQPDLANYTFGRHEGTIDPRIQFRNPTTLEDEDDAVAPLTAIPNSAISLNQEDLEEMQQQLNQRRRSSAHIFGFNQMSLGDPNNGENPIPDPFTASMVAQEHQRKLQQLQQHFAASAAGPGGPGNPALAPQAQNWAPDQMPQGNGKGHGEAKELWKAFMEPMADQNASSGPPPHLQGSFVPLNPYYAKDSRPEMPPRSLSKSSSMPDLQSPITEPATLNLQPDQPARNRAAQDDTDAMKRWRSEIRDRQSQSVFSLSPSSSSTRMKIDPSAFLNAATAAQSASRPMASVLQHSSALEQTLAPERTPSFGLDNLSTPMPAAFAFPGISSNNSFTGKSPRSQLANNAAPPPASPTGWSWKTTSVNARPGNKRLASQTLVGDAPKVGKTGGAAFGFWDDDEVEPDFGGLTHNVGGGELKVG